MGIKGEIISVGYDHNGELDYRISPSRIEGLDIKQMREVRNSILLAYFEAERYWQVKQWDKPENQATQAVKGITT